jgi:hypothetical protein
LWKWKKPADWRQPTERSADPDLAEKDDVVIVEFIKATRQPLVWADIHVRIDRIDYVAALGLTPRLIKENN